MIPQLVIEERPQEPALVRAPQLGPPALRQGLLGRVENQSERGMKEIDALMRLQMYEQIFLLGSHLQSAKDTYALLISENEALKKQVAERAIALEKEWLSKAEKLSAKVDSLYLCLNQFHLQLSAENQEAIKLHNLSTSCAVDGNWDYNKLWKTFQGSYWKLGAASAVIGMYNTYIHHMEQSLDAISKLQPTCQESLKAAAKAEIQKITQEMGINEPVIRVPKDLQQIIPFEPDSVHAVGEGDEFQFYTQWRQKEIHLQEALNDSIRSKNEILKKKANQTYDQRLLHLFYCCIGPCYSIDNRIKAVLTLRELYTQDYSKELAALTPSMQASSSNAGLFAHAIALNDRLKSHLTEVTPMVEAIQKIGAQ